MYSAALCTANSDSPYASALLLLDLLFSNNDVYFLLSRRVQNQVFQKDKMSRFNKCMPETFTTNKKLVVYVSVVLSELYSRLNLHLVRANAAAILSRWLPS